MTIDELKKKLEQARRAYREAADALNDHGIVYYAARKKKLTAKIAKLQCKQS